MSRTLILVDIQNDFCPEGALAVPKGNEVIPVANRLLETKGVFDLIIATQDWHPADHLSFASQHAGSIGDVIELGGFTQVLWPDHCVQNTMGAELTPGLKKDRIDRIIYKGIHREIDSYSCFFENDHKTATGLEDFLRLKGVTTVFIMGLATDYCVKYSVLDALELNMETVVIQDGCRGVELNPGDVKQAEMEMRQKGARFCGSHELI
ncbi:MAG: bifunctional nicotinamidase/pyrazinamidase [Deltaproteobacteria bacterium]|nr:bifunctional nicotinamidase/pyrazinamidase [Deltaproteobacteria bacterium]